MYFFKKVGLFVLDTFQVVVFSIAVFLFIYLIILRPSVVKGSSMEPNLHDGQKLIIEKISYRFKVPQRGDIIVFKPDHEESKELVKRIIGLPGEIVSIQGGKVLINGQILNESYINFYTHGGIFLQENMSLLVPDDHYFVMGDNRPRSSDSRSWGLVNKDNITGRSIFTYWPTPDLGIMNHPTY